jgi:hypothetical protein
VGVTCVILGAAGGIGWRWWQGQASGPKWRMGRWTPEPRVP